MKHRYSIRYVLVDEYQDANFVQEQLLLKLTEQTGNLCVVGDEDQSLYRFRGATDSHLAGRLATTSAWPARLRQDGLAGRRQLVRKSFANIRIGVVPFGVTIVGFGDLVQQTRSKG